MRMSLSLVLDASGETWVNWSGGSWVSIFVFSMVPDGV